MAPHLRVQNYLDRHKITPLFEDLMNKVVHDMPDEPILYMIKLLYKKAGKPIPDDLRFTGMRKSIHDLNRSRSPEMSRKTRLTQSTTQLGSPDKSPTRTTKLKKSPEKDAGKEVRKSRPDWNNDVKNVTIAEPTRLTRQTSHDRQQGRHAWASIGLDNEETLYSSGRYRGPYMEDTDPLLNELSVVSLADTESHGVPHSAHISSRKRNLKQDAARHKRELSAMLANKERVTLCDSGFDSDNPQDDAIELLEDADDLINEGVTNIPASGYKLSKIMRERKAESEVKLNINLYPRSQPGRSRHIEGTRYGELPDFDNDSDYDDRPPTGLKSYAGDSDEEFESVSQVTGPRHPVWTEAASDVVTRTKHITSPSARHVSSSAQFRSYSPEEPRSWNKKLTMSSPSPHNMFTSLDSGEFVQEPHHQAQAPEEETGVYHGGNRGWMQSEGSGVSTKPWSLDPRQY